MRIFFDNLFLEVLTFLCLITYLIYYYLTSTFSFWKKKNIQFIEPEIFFGNMKEIVTFKKSQPIKFSEFYSYFKKLGLKYGGIFQLRLPVLLVCSPELVKNMLIKDFPSFHDRGFAHDENFDPLSANLIFLDGQQWKFVRSKLTPTYSTGKLKNMVEIMREAGGNLLKVMENAVEGPGIIEMKEVFAQYTTDVVGSCAFGLQFNTLRDGKSEFREWGKKVFALSKKEKFLQVVRNSSPWIYKTFRLRFFSKEMTDFFTNIVKETAQYRRDNNIVRQDFFHYLMQIKQTKAANLKEVEEMKGVENYNTAVDENAIELTDAVITAQAFIFFLAGYETSSTTMSFCLRELADHPEIQEKIHEEVVEVLKKHKELNYDALQELTYMGQVIDETLRLYPAAPLVLRKCTKPYKLPDSDVILEPGQTVFFPIYSFHRDPEYFPDPEEFRPERFSPENREKIKPHTYMPFGEGPRTCIGMRFAILQVKMSLSLIHFNYKIEKCDKTQPIEIDPRIFTLTTKDGIWLKIIKR